LKEAAHAVPPPGNQLLNPPPHQLNHIKKRFCTGIHNRYPHHFPLAIIQLGANVFQPAGVDAVRLTLHGFDQLFASEFFKDGERAVAEQQPFSGITLNGGDAARGVTGVDDASTFGENV
jgi:hypothetical protein